MNSVKKIILVVLLCAMCSLSSGCALLKAPLALVSLPFMVLGKVMGLVSKLPKPPPGVFF